MRLFDLLDASASARTSVVFPTLRRVVSVADLWRQAAGVRGWVRRRVPQGQAIAMLLDTSPECLACFLGALRSGRRVVSLPLPARGASPDEYERLLRSILARVDASVVVVDARVVPSLSELDVPAWTFQGVIASSVTVGREGGRGAVGELVQFTSGATADPKGVRVSVAQIGANVESILDRLGPRPGDGACSWLPLAHDMGLIGMTLASLCAGGRGHADGGSLVLIPPEHFLRDPTAWLQACSRFGSTITAAPDFALRLVARRGVPVDVDLSSLRACIVGGEPVRAATLDSFTAALASCGFRPEALCPSYGLAEATLAVTMLDPAEHWRAVPVPVPGADGISVVSSGTPVAGTEVSVEPAGSDAGDGSGVGRIRVAGPSVCRGYLGEADNDGSVLTSDEGFLLDGHLHVVGRADDTVVVRGRNLRAPDLEVVVERVAGVRGGAAVVVPHDGGYAVVAEVELSARSDLGACAEAVRRALVACCGAQPHRVVLVEKGALPRTASGKKRRPLVARLLAAGELGSSCDRTYAEL